jgi:hypothetical protein
MEEGGNCVPEEGEIWISGKGTPVGMLKIELPS